MRTIQYWNNKGLKLAFLSVLLFITFQIGLAQLNGRESYWIYQREGNRYRMELDKASSIGIDPRDKPISLTLRVIFTEQEYNTLIKNSANLPLQVEWYRYNRAKLSIFNVQSLSVDKILTINSGAVKGYYFDVTQDTILGGTWVVKISDSQGHPVIIANKSQYSVSILQ